MSDFNRHKRDIEYRRSEKQKREKTHNRENLKYRVGKKIETTMIGALDSFEHFFGYLWNHGSEERTDEEQDFYELWLETREEILNKGNDQIRSANSEIDTYDVKYIKRKMFFKVGDMVR